MSALSAGLSWIFQPQCAACGGLVAAGLPFCAGCAPTLLDNGVACPRCAEVLPGPRPEVCLRCRRRPLPLEQIIAPWQYGGALAEAIVRLKFQRRAELARTLAPLIAPVLAATAHAMEASLVVPVPLHWSRRLRRGFDQSQLLLAHSAALAPLPAVIASVLRRHRRTPYQSRAALTERMHNLAAAISVRPRWRGRLSGARVVLFDDVVTTGATLAACARALRAAGAASVVAVALARG